MKIQKLILVLIASLASVGVQAESGGCARCDEIRADNAINHKNYEYYDDYQKTQNCCVTPAVAPKAVAPVAPVAAPKVVAPVAPVAPADAPLTPAKAPIAPAKSPAPVVAK